MQEVARIKAEFADVASQEMGAKGAVVEGMDGRQKGRWMKGVTE